MIGSAPYFTFWQVAEKWANETNKPVIDVIQAMRNHSTYDDSCLPNSPPPALIIWPTECFSSRGKVNETTVFNANKLVEKEQSESVNGTKFRSNLYTPEYIAALAFLNSAKCPSEPTDCIKNHLSLFAIRREDFENWCRVAEEPLPRFWFNTIGTEQQEVLSSKKQRSDLLKIEINDVIAELGGEPTPKKIMMKLQEYAGSEGSCIVEAKSDGVIWKNNLGKKKHLDLEALGKRLSRGRTTSRR